MSQHFVNFKEILIGWLSQIYINVTEPENFCFYATNTTVN